MHPYGGGGGGGTNVHDDCARADHSDTDVSAVAARHQTGFFAVVTRTGVRELPPKPRRVVKAPARRHNRRRGLSNNTRHTSSHLHLAAAAAAAVTVVVGGHHAAATDKCDGCDIIRTTFRRRTLCAS